MSTRSTVTVYEDGQGYSVYRHGDGYPDTEHGVLEGLRAALANAWPWPRFEADDYAAAIVATWRTGAGGIRLTSGRDAHGDTEYHYDVSLAPAGHALFVKVWGRGYGGNWKPVSAALVFPDKVKPVKLSKADQAKASVAREASAVAGEQDEATDALAELREGFETTQREVAELRAQVRALMSQASTRKRLAVELLGQG
jgi:hypothetical protein